MTMMTMMMIFLIRISVTEIVNSFNANFLYLRNVSENELTNLANSVKQQVCLLL